MRRSVIRRHQLRKRRRGLMTLQLTSLMDILMIIVVFLLKSYGMSAMNINSTNKLDLPLSKAPETVGEGTALVIARDRIILNDQAVIEFEGDSEARRFVLPASSKDPRRPDKGLLPLYDALVKLRKDFELLASRSE